MLNSGAKFWSLFLLSSRKHPDWRHNKLAWFVQDSKALQGMIKTTQNIIGTHQPRALIVLPEPRTNRSSKGPPACYVFKGFPLQPQPDHPAAFWQEIHECPLPNENKTNDEVASVLNSQHSTIENSCFPFMSHIRTKSHFLLSYNTVVKCQLNGPLKPLNARLIYNEM